VTVDLATPINIARSDEAEDHSKALLSTLKLDKPVLDPDTGFLHATIVSARLGVQPYPEYGVAHYRDEKFLKQLAERLRYKPLVDGHHEISPTQNIEKQVGLIVESKVKGPLTVQQVVIHDAILIKRILSKEDKELGLSVGYDALCVPVGHQTWSDVNGIAGLPGQEYAYQVHQTNPRPNHVAVVPLGRGGHILKIIDEPSITSGSSPLSSMDNNKMEMIDKNPDFAALNDRMGAIEDSLKALKDMPSTYDSMHKDMDDKFKHIADSIAQNNSTIMSAIKEAFYGQERKYGTETSEVPKIEAAAGTAPNTVPHLRDSADFSASVAESTGLWLRHKDELLAAGADLTASPDDLRATILAGHKIAIGDSLEGDNRSLALRSAYDAFLVTSEAAQNTLAAPVSAAQRLFDSMNVAEASSSSSSSSSSAEAALSQKLADSYDFGGGATVKITRMANGTVNYG
jgi:hypothetical protein